MAEELITIEHLQKKFADETVLEDVSTSIRRGEVVCVIGPSGTGKSTFLRCLNRLETPSSGRIIFDGADMGARDCNLSRLRQKMGMVFQSFNLYHHMNVIDNIMYAPMKVLGLPREEAYQRGRKLLRIVGLEEKEKSFPDELSGGQKQRIAIARTLAMKPEVILFDEPTSALDPTMEGEVVAVIRRLAQEGMTMVIVTHNMRLARSIATRVIYMDHGTICEEGSPGQIFDHPQKEETRRFINGLSGLHMSFLRDELDYLGLLSKINELAVRKLFSPKFVYRIEASVEEIYLQTILPTLQDNIRILFDLEYSEKLENCEIRFRWSSAPHNPLTEMDELSRRLAEHAARDIQYHCGEDGSNEIRIIVEE